MESKEKEKEEITLSKRDEALKTKILKFLERNKLPETISPPMGEKEFINNLNKEKLTIKEKIIEWNGFTAGICLEELVEKNIIPDLYYLLTKRMNELKLARRLATSMLGVDLPFVKNLWEY